MPIHKTKHCKRCDTTKTSDEFYRRRKGADLSPYCRKCSNLQTVERQRKLKQKAIDYLGGKCNKCGYDKCPAALDFHHLDPAEKDFTISQVSRTSWNDKLKAELDKCVLLCANCHRETHWEEKHFINLSPKKEKKVYSCHSCGSGITNKAKQCKKCYFKRREKVQWPEVESLIEMVSSKGYSATGRELGVSDAAVRKRIKNHKKSS
jgi:hypothetical protein